MPVSFARFVAALAGAGLLVAAAPSPALPATYPTNAAKIFRWGNATVKDEFKAPLSARWSVSDRALVRNQHGMLTLDSGSTGDDVSATLTGGDRQYGRWEARVRGRRYGALATPYRLVWELVPTSGEQCARSILLSDYRLGTSRAAMHLRNGADDFTTGLTLALTRNQFHTYAVEVTPDRISWFVDTRVVMTERRPEARTAATYAVRFRLVGTPGATMDRGRMQMDWVRYYTLARPNARSVEAPPATRTTYDGSC